MTKCIVLGENKSINDKRPIQFTGHLNKSTADIWRNECQSPRTWSNIELISKNNAAGEDIMFAYNNKREDGILYLGHWNDGIV